jgi:hypothetical protein
VAGRPATLKVEILGDAKGLGRGTAEAEGKLSRLGGAARKVGKVIAVGLAAGAAAVGALAVASVKAASDQEQAFGALDSVYGKNSATVKRWANDAADAVGLSATSYANLSAVVGSQLKNMGRSTSEAAGESDKLIKMGADLAATFGGSVSDAVGAVGSLLRGERDPIERYGVAIKQADIDAQLARDGLTGLTGAALRQAEANATLTLLTKQTADAQGAFGRESNTLAGQTERLKAEFDNAKAALGSRLLPALATGVRWVREELAPAARALWQDLSARLGPAISRVGEFLTGTLVPAVRRAHEWFVDKIAPGIRSAVTPVIDGLRSAFSSVSGTIDDNREGLGKIANVLRTVAEFIATKVAPVVGTVLGGAFRILGKSISAQITIISGIANAIGFLIDKLGALASAVKNSPIGKLAGALFGGPPLAVGSPSLAVGRPSVALPNGLATASGMTTFDASPFDLGGLGLTRATSLVTVVDRRTIDARLVVEGDLLDADGGARKLDRLSRSHARRVGAAAGLTGATA